MITFLDPRSEPGTPVEDYSLSVDLEAGSTVVGLVANGFPDSEEFLDEIEKVMAAQLPQVSVRRWNKRNASATISDDMLDEVVGECQAVVAAYGH